MKLVYCILLFFLLVSFSSCYAPDEVLPDGNVEVVFKANKTVANTTSEQVDDNLSVLIFKSDKSGVFSFLSNEEDTEWTLEADGNVTKKVLLSTGNYRFLMARSCSSGSSGNIVFSGDGEAKGGYDRDYYFKYPSADNDGDMQLQPCSTELFIDSNEPELDSNEPELDSNEKEYNLYEGNQFSVSRKITRVQGRLDFMVRRGKKEYNEAVQPIPEGDNNVNAFDNALAKITSIQVKAENVSTRCHVAGLTFSTPGSYSFGLLKADFTFFNPADFAAELKDVLPTDYSAFNNSAYQKGPLLFPAPECGSISLEITINYAKPLQPKIINHQVELHRNKIVLVILWLLNEEIGVEVAVDQDNLIFGDGTASGDDGFWN